MNRPGNREKNYQDPMRKEFVTVGSDPVTTGTCSEPVNCVKTRLKRLSDSIAAQKLFKQAL